jgi:hypothetical protein
MSEPLHVFGPDELFGCQEYWEFEVEAIPCQPGADSKSTSGTLEFDSGGSLTELPANQTNQSDDPDRPAA